MTQIIGIDPGVGGACSLVSENGRFLGCFDMPTVLANKSSNRQMVNAYELAKLLRMWMLEAPAGVVAVTENVNAMPDQGVASVFAFGKSYGIVLGVLAALGVSTEIIAPAKWKGHFRLGREKEASRELAQRLFPDAPLGLKKHHNRAEAILLARYYQQRMQAPARAPAASGTGAAVAAF